MDSVGDDEIRKNINLIINYTPNEGNPTNINTGVDKIRKHITEMKSWTSDEVRKYDIELMLLTDEEKAKYGKNIVPIAYDILTNINDLPNSQI